ncbi:hypothetical protein ES288_D02G083400v1 [Gossypium darwinii]|nr:hypothetical protein ES288_D08G117900v1 [Gossypium darwinii]TYG78727.1 hypothetical protein ES288_D02G083400v1 [Gossypium darwinii]
MDGHLKTILEGISKLASDKVLAEDELASLQSILVKLLSHFKDLEHVFSLILDMMHGNSRGIVNMHILDMATRNGYVHDPTTIQLLFEISQALHSDTDLVNMKNDANQQQARFISRFVRMVDYGVEYERHLAFLMECRGALSNIIELKINEHVLSVCSKLIETAKLCLNAKDKYLTSTISFLHKNLPAAAVSSSIAI